MPTIARNSLMVEVAEDGVGPPVVLLHSSVSGNRQWKKLTEQLRDRYRVSAPNLYGYGSTSAWPDTAGPQTLQAAVEPVMAVLDGIEGPVRIVGHSWGGSVALQAAALLGERVSHLVLFEPMMAALLRTHHRSTEWEEAEALYRDVKRYGGDGQWEALAARFTAYFNGEGAWEATPPDRQKLVASLLKPNYYEWDAASEDHTAESFKRITARTLLMRSANTRPAIREISNILREQFPHWTFHEIETGGHMAPLTRPDLVNPTIGTFLDS